MAPIYYFGYGPIVNPVVRKRRGVKTSGEQGAFLPEHRLTFAFGGVVNMIKQRGYEVQGILIRFDNEEEWSKFQEFDAGYNLDQVQVYTYSDPEGDPVLAYAFVMKEYDGDKVEGTIETLPQERYLKLIAAGMRAYNLDEDYIEDQIMSIPYVPKTKPENFKRFAKAKRILPKISFDKYTKQLCQNSSRGDVYFVCGKHIIHLNGHDPENPCSVWIRDRAHGKPDLTLILHRTVVDPDLPMVDTEEEITDAHRAWAENHMVEYLEQGGLTAQALFELADEEPMEQIWAPTSWCPYCCPSRNASDERTGVTRRPGGHDRDILEEQSPSVPSLALEILRDESGDTDNSSLA